MFRCVECGHISVDGLVWTPEEMSHNKCITYEYTVCNSKLCKLSAKIHLQNWLFWLKRKE